MATDPDLAAAKGRTLYDLATKSDLPQPAFLTKRFKKSEKLLKRARVEDPAAHALAVEISWDAVAREMREAIALHGKRYSHEEALEVVQRNSRVSGGGGVATGASAATAAAVV
jgi:hypothetical protein